MKNVHKAGLATLVGLVGLGCGHAAMAQNAPRNEPANQEAQPQGVDAPQGNTPDRTTGKQKGLGAGIGDQGNAQGMDSDKAAADKSADKGAADKGFVLGPLDTSAATVGTTRGSYGAGIGGEAPDQGKTAAAQPAPVPQYWIADASLFVANAENTAQTLANEQVLGVQAPSVLGNQAQFLLAASDRALTSLASLQANAEGTNPKAVSDIRAAMDQLVAAKGQAQQALDAANAGSLGPSQHASIRSAHEHLQAAEKSMAAVSRAYNAQGYTLAQGCTFRGRGLGAGIGGKAMAPKAPDKGTAPAPEQPAPAPAPEPAKP